MNNRREYYFPVTAYTVLLLLVWLVSWLVVVAELLLDTDMGINSLISAEGVRWAVRSAIPSLNSVSWGTIMLVLVSAGLLRSSGLLRFVSHLFSQSRLTSNERRAALFTLLALLFYSLLLYMSTASPWSLLLGVTGSFAASPFMQGALLLLSLGVLLLAVVYGFVYGNYRSLNDVTGGVQECIVLFTPALQAVIPASGIIPCLDYTGFFACLEMTASDVNVIGDIVVSLPFLHTILLHLIDKKE